MATQKKLSLFSAIFINLNIIIGAGLFINSYDIAAKSGAAGFLLYPAIGLCMLPLISIMGKLSGMFPTGGLYAFGNSSSPFLGFLSCWSYFFGKTASSTVMISVGSAMLRQLIPAMNSLHPMTIFLIILTIFTILNLQNMKVGMMVQSFFLTSKCIPILFVIIAGIMLFDTSSITVTSLMSSDLAINIPIVLYCFAGFEATCSLSRNIENPTVNGPKAIYYSFAIIIILYGIFQGFVYMNTHSAIAAMTSYRDIYPSIAHKLFSSELIANKMSILLNFAIGSSALGGAYGIMFSNSWNLYTLAENDHTFGSKIITQLNKHQTPWVAVLIQSLICLMFLLTNQSAVMNLRQTTALGMIIAYTISSFAYYQLLKKSGGTKIEMIISQAAFATCMLFILSCANSFFETGLTPLFIFIVILATGCSMFVHKRKTKQ